MQSHETIGATDDTASEAYQALLARAHRGTGAIPPERIVRHVLSVTRGGDWPVQREALDAVLRRCASARTDEIRVIRRPRGGPLGLYATRRRGSRAIPYRTRLRQLERLEGSCDCADFLRNSLGLCKHLVAVLELVASRPRRSAVERESPRASMPLRWDPIRPLTGPGDWLARVRWVDGTPDRALRRRLRPANGGSWTVSVPGTPQQRLVLLTQLLDVLHSGDAEPALHALLRQERARLEHQTQTAATRRALQQALKTLKHSLYRYQHDGVDRFLLRGRLLLADDMGLGKTAQAIAACHALWHTGRVQRGLLVVPAALKPQWLREWQHFTDAPA
ncbi:MAG: SNF2-related protein, partial [Vicinamibacterales bacterium]